MARPDRKGGHRLSQPTPAATPTTATMPEIGAILLGRVDDVTAEAAEQLAYDWYLADECEHPPGLEHCACSCLWCSEREPT